MMKLKKKNSPMPESFENILNVQLLNIELHHSFSFINNMTYSDSQNRVRERDICIHKAIAQA
jgi:hypothetical protein